MSQQRKETLDRIVNHYSRQELIQEIDRFLEHFQSTGQTIPVNNLLRFDQIHMGGRVISELLLQNISLDSHSIIGDVGCGLGGTTRLLSEKYGCSVIGIDLNRLYCACAQKLSDHSSISPLNSFVTADLLQVPLVDNRVDMLWSQHIIMNIEDKEKLLDEYYRILKPGGRLVFHEVFSGNGEPILYPVPWAAADSESFLTPLPFFREMTQNRGFTGEFIDQSEWSLRWWEKLFAGPRSDKKQPSNKPAFSIFGKTGLIMVKNVYQNIVEGKLMVCSAILEKK